MAFPRFARFELQQGLLHEEEPEEKLHHGCQKDLACRSWQAAEGEALPPPLLLLHEPRSGVLNATFTLLVAALGRHTYPRSKFARLH